MAEILDEYTSRYSTDVVYRMSRSVNRDLRAIADNLDWTVNGVRYLRLRLGLLD